MVNCQTGNHLTKTRNKKGKEGTGDLQSIMKKKKQRGSTTSAIDFSKEQLKQFYSILLKLPVQANPSPTSSASVVQKGDYISILSANTKIKEPWIINFGVSDHMTSNHTLFSTYALCHGTLKIKIVDGSPSSVVGKGTIKISEKLMILFFMCLILLVICYPSTN